MTTSLDRLLQPGERVLFRTRWGWGRTLRFVALMGGLAVLCGGAVFFIVPGNDFRFALALAASSLFSSLAQPLMGHGTEAVLTELRVIYRTGLFRPKTVEIPLWNLAEVTRARVILKLTDRAGATSEWWHLPEPEKLAAAIMAQAGLPGPPALPEKLEKWDQAGFNAALYGSLGLLTAGMFGLYALVDLGAMLTDSGWHEWRAEWDNPEVPEAVTWAFYLAVFLPAGLVFGVAWVIAMVAGTVPGLLLMAAAMRRRLSAAEARAIFESRLGDLAQAPFGGLWRLPYRPARALAARLYGEPV